MLTLSFVGNDIVLDLQLDAAETPHSKKPRIEDFGEKIGGARKDYYGNARFELSSISKDQLDHCKHLTDLITMPNFGQMVKEGHITQQQACAAFAMWHQIPKLTQRSSWRWASETFDILSKVNYLLGEMPEDIDAYLNKQSEQAYLEYHTLLAADYPEKDFSFGNYRVHTCYYYDHKTGKGSFSKYCITTIGRSSHYVWCDLDTFEDVANAMNDILNRRKKRKTSTSDDSSDVKPIELKYLQSRISGKYFCTAKKKALRSIHLMEWNTRQEMQAFRHNEELRKPVYEKYWQMVNIPNERHSMNRPRIGEEWLPKDKELMPSDLAAAFPFRGIEFGNWVTQDQRAAFINDTYVALKDMLTVLNLSPENITCSKDLAIAFGARGRGGNVLAHYEPLHRVINLTKTRGAGSLAHEWFHAIDRFASGNQTLLTDRSVNIHGGNFVQLAASRLVSKMRYLDYYKRCGLVDACKDKKYWSTPCEMAARAFEALLIELLAARGWRSDFLASITSYEAWPNKDTYVYPTPYELQQLAPCFDEFFQTLFHITSFMTPEVNAHFDCLVEKWEKSNAA